MGKKTLYHPVSLHVIRGALEYCGIKLGRLVQIRASIEYGTATYRATVIELPRSMTSNPTWELAKELQSCFAQDVTVLYVTSHYDVKRKKTALTATLFCDIHDATPMEAMLSEKQHTELESDQKNLAKMHKEYMRDGIYDDEQKHTEDLTWLN